jgi:uncharacterized membrane protein YczE
VSNVVVVGLAMNATLAVLAPQHGGVPRAATLAGAVLLCGLATGMYISAGFGPGPRDGLMTGLVRRTGWSVRLVRTSIELSVLAAGFALGGTVGLGTALYAVAIGPLLGRLLPVFLVPLSPVRPGPDPYRDWLATYRAARPGAVVRCW